MLVVGLTGGIGSGKTTVAELFKVLGVDIIDADIIAHTLTRKNSGAVEKIIQHFGKDIIDKVGNLDRLALKKRIFSSPEEKKWLENLLHPLIREQIVLEISQARSHYCIVVIPLLFEAKKIDYIDRIITVDATKEQQIARIKKREHLDDATIEKILNTQVTREYRLAHADDIIDNTSDLQALQKQVNHYHDLYQNS